MGILNYNVSERRFHFVAVTQAEERLAHQAGLVRVEALRWATRNYHKAVTLRRFADESAEQKFKKYFITHFAPPESIPYPDHLDPKVFQLESAWHCVTRSPAYCADEAGLGKTITSILCMNAVPGKTLIICPPYLKHNWWDEILKWNVGLPRQLGMIESSNTKEAERAINSDIVILPDSLVINPAIKLLLSKHKFTWLFVDEAHRYKEATTQRTQSLVGKEDEPKWEYITQYATRVVLLSGTPIPNGRPIELYPLLSQLAPEAIGHRTALAFGKRFCGGRQITRYEGKRAIAHWDFRGSSNLKQLRTELRQKLMIRHLKRDVLKELGPKTRQIIFLDEPTRLKEFEKRALRNHSLEDLMGEDAGLGDIATYRREVGQAKIIPAFTYIHELLENSPNKLVVFAHHIEVVQSLTALLQEFNPLMIRGGLSSEEKANRVRFFQTRDKCRVIVGNMDAMGVGNTLTKAPGVIIVEPSWVPGINEQAEDRVHRMTQNQNVYCRYLVLRNSLDERMLHSVLSKQDAINSVMA